MTATQKAAIAATSTSGSLVNTGLGSGVGYFVGKWATHALPWLADSDSEMTIAAACGICSALLILLSRFAVFLAHLATPRGPEL